MARPARGAERTVAILDFLAAHPADAFTLSELSRRLEINAASMHALLATLTDAGYLVRHPTHKTYRLGPLLVPIGHAAASVHAVVDVARRELATLAGDVGLEGLVAASTGRDLAILDSVGRRGRHGLRTTVGQRVPLAAPIGGVLVAWADPAEVDAWLDRGAPADRPAHEAMLAELRARGWGAGLERGATRGLPHALAAVQDEPASRRARRELSETLGALTRAGTLLGELEPDERSRVRYCAAPVFDARGSVVVALYLVGFRDLRTGAEVATLAERLVAVANAVTAATHGESPVTVTPGL